MRFPRNSLYLFGEAAKEKSNCLRKKKPELRKHSRVRAGKLREVRKGRHKELYPKRKK